MNRHHYGLAAVFDTEEKRQKASTTRFARGHLSEFLDVSSGNKRASAADKDRSLHRGIVVDLFDGVGNSFRNSGTEGIHRGIVDGDDGDTVVFAQPYQTAHRELRSLPPHGAGTGSITRRAMRSR
jgi:hypothetical protein